ncbi:class I SAM-dependent methyltransferase [Nitrosomonas sp.]|uniref:class I SAM-dependent methyltransferase n=1 Tax=Nitrosomonas sp. TaxID=42353 RepID=UPI0025F54554|nr:class I SAM-dependent methyltransferase [Nitrosomonas sp.]MBY0482944.1 methyltransferase domain-containing protein [Nitrosomonas sp.]
MNHRYGFLKQGDKILEVGTGWLHWEAIVIRLCFDVRSVLCDVWDNRQLTALKDYIAQLEGMLDELNGDDAQLDGARRLISQIKAVQSFDELYRLLDFIYVIDKSGELASFEQEAFDFVVSSDVLEHVHKDSAFSLVKGFAKVLKPGGYSMHKNDMNDHLYYYSNTVSPKQYMHYSDRIWKRYFENDVQYINRIQLPEWRAMFHDAGLELVHEETRLEDLKGLELAPLYQDLLLDEKTCSNVIFLYRKSL